MIIELTKDEACVVYEALKMHAAQCDKNDLRLMEMVDVMKKIYVDPAFPQDVYNEPEKSVEV